MHKNVFVVRYLWQDGIALFGKKIPGYSVSLLAQIFSRHRHTYHTHALTHALVFVYMYSCMYVCGRQWVNWRASDIPRARPHTHKNTHVHMHTSPLDGVAAWNELASMILTYTCTQSLTHACTTVTWAASSNSQQHLVNLNTHRHEM